MVEYFVVHSEIIAVGLNFVVQVDMVMIGDETTNVVAFPRIVVVDELKTLRRRNICDNYSRFEFGCGCVKSLWLTETKKRLTFLFF